MGPGPSSVFTAICRPSAQGVRATVSMRIPFMSESSSISPVSQTILPAPLCHPAVDGGGKIVVTGEGHGGDDVGDSSTADDECRVPVAA
jgi:hypothetical protein